MPGEVFSFKKDTETTGVITILYRNFGRFANSICKVELPYVISQESKKIRVVGLSDYRKLQYFDDYLDLIAIDKDRIIYDKCNLIRAYTRTITTGINSLDQIFYLDTKKTY